MAVWIIAIVVGGLTVQDAVKSICGRKPKDKNQDL